MLRSLCDAALTSAGLSIAEQQFALVTPAGEIITTSFRTSPEDRGRWLPVEDEDTAPYDPATTWRLKPLALRVDGDRVIRTWPVVPKCQEHA
ncbi:hypothetical protein [Bradyrhizobium diazoefficiens]|uniref:hypothetical protein n=1 Tax=Bradyrhizobium diazoefficiens TaxID=1355477 RepID=UPI0036F3383E